MVTTINDVALECMQGDISNQSDVDAVVNAANAQLQTGGGVAGAIHGAAGPQLAEAGQQYAPLKPGQAVITPAFDLPNQHVIHALGPVYGRDKPSSELLKSCYEESLRLAEENEIQSIAFPAISTGAFGYPMKSAAQIALRTVTEQTAMLDNVKRIRFVLWGDSAFQTHRDVMESLIDG